MRILFWGTPHFAVPSLRALADEGFEVVGVVTRPDRPAGRGRRLRPSAIKGLAVEQGFGVLAPERPEGDDFLGSVRALEPDLSVVVAYGHLLKPEVLALPRLGSINVHASLLPELRGAAPLTWAIARGHQESGVTIMRMVEAMDAGAIIRQVREPILPDETASELSVRLSELGAQALVTALSLLSAGQADEVEQDHEAATYAPKVDRETARIDWSRSARDVALHVRGMDEVPGAWSMLAGTPVKLFRSAVVEPSGTSAPSRAGPSGNAGPPSADEAPRPGTVLAADPDRGVHVAVREGAVRLDEVQPAGGRRMSATDWINGRGVVPGQRFE